MGAWKKRWTLGLFERIEAGNEMGERTYAHEFLHLLSLHTGLKLSLLGSCQSGERLACVSMSSGLEMRTHPSWRYWGDGERRVIGWFEGYW